MIYGEELGAGGISTKTIPPQGLNLTLKGGNGKIDCTFTGITSEWLYLGQYYRLIAKPGSAPTSPMDGVQVKDVQVGAIGDAVISASIEGLTNGVQYYVRLYVRGENGWQTSVDAVGTATPVAGIAISTLAVGSEVKIKLGGVPYNHLVVHQGKPSSIYDDSCNGTWMLCKEIFEMRQWHSSNVNDYANSTIHAYLNETLYNEFDLAVRAAIKQVKIPYTSDVSNKTVATNEAGLSAKIFLPAGFELGLSSGFYWTSYMPDDGARWAYFEAGINVVANNKRIAYKEGTATSYWTRSPVWNKTATVWYVYPDGTCSYPNGSGSGASCINITIGVRPALILPADFRLNPEPNPDGSYSPLAA